MHRVGDVVTYIYSSGRRYTYNALTTIKTHTFTSVAGALARDGRKKKLERRMNRVQNQEVSPNMNEVRARRKKTSLNENK